MAGSRLVLHSAYRCTEQCGYAGYSQPRLQICLEKRKCIHEYLARRCYFFVKVIFLLAFILFLVPKMIWWDVSNILSNIPLRSLAFSNPQTVSGPSTIGGVGAVLDCLCFVDCAPSPWCQKEDRQGSADPRRLLCRLWQGLTSSTELSTHYCSCFL